jgi:hypothetical protein
MVTSWFVTQCIVVGDDHLFRANCLLNVYIYREDGSRNLRRN